METKVYKNLAKIFGIILAVVGIAALIGANFAKGFIAEQLGEQNITIADEEGLKAQLESGRLTQEDYDEMVKYAGQKMENGNQAKAFANHFIGAHMRAGAAGAGYPDATYSTLGGIYSEFENAAKEEIKADNPNASEEEIAKLAAKEIKDPTTKYESAAKAAEIEDLRQGTFLDGNTLRGMLLNAYGWGLVGTIALWVGIGALIAGILLAVWGFIPAKKTATAKNGKVVVTK